MALLKLTNKKGIDASYWVVTGWNQNKSNQTAVVDIRLYKDQAAKDESLENHLESIQVTVPGYNLALAEIYTLIKISNSPLDTVTYPEDGHGDPERVFFFGDAQDDI